MFFYIAILAWIGGVIISFYNGNRGLPLIVLLVGIAAWVATAMVGAPSFGIAAIALLAAIIWIANKSDTL